MPSFGELITRKVAGFFLKAIAIVAVIAIIIMVFATVQEREYVADNYIVTSSQSKTGTRRAFVSSYVKATGDLTMPGTVGLNMEDLHIGTGSDLSALVSSYEYNDSDLRPLVQAVTEKWVEFMAAGSNTTAINLCNKIYELKATGADYTTSKGQLSNEMNTYDVVYQRSGSANTYQYEYNGNTYTKSSMRCCCCLTESCVSILSGMNGLTYYGTGGCGYHVFAAGTPYTQAGDSLRQAHISGSRKFASGISQRRTYPINGTDTTVVVYPPFLDTYNSGVKTYGQWVEQNLLGVGSICMFYRNNGEDTMGHVEIVTYIDRDAKKVYTAGAGSDGAIGLDYLFGYNHVFSFDDDIIDANGRNNPIVSVTHWKNTYLVRNGDGNLQ